MKDIPVDYNNIRDLGSRIYTDYLLPFELAAVLLLLGMSYRDCIGSPQNHQSETYGSSRPS